jgi:hypothetical protein
MRYGLDNQGIGVRFPVGARYFSLPHNVQTSSALHVLPTLRKVEPRIPPLLNTSSRLGIH